MIRIGNWVTYKWGDEECRGKVVRIEYDTFNKESVILENDYGESAYRRVYVKDVIGVIIQGD